MVSNAFNLANVAPNTSNSNVSVTGFNANVAVGQYINAANVQVTNAILFADGSQLTSAIGSVAVFDYTGDGTTTTYSTGNYAATSTLNTSVYIGGVYQRKNQYAWVGTNIIFNTAPPASTNIEIVVNTLNAPIATPNNGSVYPITLSPGGPSWDTTGNLTVSGNVSARLFNLSTTTTAPPVGLFSPGTNQLGFATNSTQQMVIDASGNLGIGLTSLTEKFEVSGSINASTASSANFNAGNQRAFMDYVPGSTTARFGHLSGASGSTTGVMAFFTNSSERMRILSTGAVTINSTGQLNTGFTNFLNVNGGIVAGSTTSTGGSIILQGYYGSGALTNFGTEYSSGGPSIGYAVYPSSSASGAFLSSYSGAIDRYAINMGGGAIRFYTGASQTVAVGSAVTIAESMRIDSSNNVGIGTTSPLAKLNLGSGIFRLDNGITTANFFATMAARYDSSHPFTLMVENNIGGTASEVMGIYSPGGGGYLNPCFPLNAATGVGIGTTSPSYKLSVNGTAVGSAVWANVNNTDTTSGALGGFFGSNGAVNAVMYASSYAGYGTYGMTTNHPMVFITNNTERMRIDTSGNMLVNTTTNSPDLGRITVAYSTGVNNGIGFVANSTIGMSACTFRNPNGQVGAIVTSGSTTTYSTSSDYRLKENVTPMTTGLEKISALKPVYFDWISDKSTGEGFIAHELQAVIPQAVTGEKDAVNEDGSIKTQGVDYSKIVVHLVAALQELSAKVTALEAMIGVQA
jgi:Chaperone of endosialidase